jgi:transcriptional regulator with AAA-type ATPase domain/tetratricopeptide (TPR) repeat protein
MDPLAELVGESQAIEAVRDQIRRLVARPEGGRRLPAILISGETGTGKGLVARILHRAGTRARGPFVDVNCAAIPDSLLEAELFGFERGAFTDARRAKPGLFQAAHHGTIFLDEVGLLPEPLQAKLLNVLEEKAVRRLGATTPEPVDAWIISATNADLQGAVRQHMFREDLYHRLAVLTLRLPPLRERGRDILILAGRFLVRVCADYGLPPKRFAREAEARLLGYPWPGNIRELGNVIERVALLAESEMVTADMLELQPMGELMPSPTPAATVSAGSLDDVMREHVLAALTQTKWNISRTAALLGISRNTLRARIDKLGLRAGGNRAATSPRAKRDERSVLGLPVDKALGPLPAAGMGPVRWERRRITLLRASIDVGGAGDDPTETSRLLGLVMDKVQSFGGRVEALAQSGFDASFGLDLLGDAPRRAANAALAIQKAVGRGAPGHTSALGVRLGLHIESCLVGNLAGSPQIDQQEKVKTSQFLETLVARADLGTVVVSDVIVPFLGRRFSLSPSARIPGTVGEAYRLVGHKSSGEGPWGRMAAFVGRRDELDLLKGRWNAVTHGSGQVIGVVGEPGVGKSRLIWEFLRGGETAAALVLQTSADILGNRTPFLPVVDLLRAYFRVESGQDPDTIRRKVTDKLADLDGALIDAGAPLLALLDVSVNDRQWSSLDATQRRQLTLEALKAICVRESQREPLVLVFEDAHWIDSETQAVLDTLVERVPTARVLVLLTYRPEYQHGWGHKTFFTQLRVDPLPPQNVEEMLDAILGTHASLTSLRSRLIEWTEGNPFFLEESVQALAEIGTLTGNLGAYRLEAPLTTLEVPGTVEELLAARVNRLPDRERALLQAASVIGREVPLALWSAIADLSEAPLRDALHRLRSAEFVYETSTFPQNIYTFRHALTQAVAYASLPEQQRRKLHARTLQRMESLWPDAFGELADRFAHHALQGQVWDKAVAHLARAGTRAFARSANREAVASFEQALQALDHLADTRDTREQKIELHLGLRNALTLLGDAPRTLQHLRQAEALAEQIGDYPKLGRALSFEANALFLMGDHPGAIKAGSRALAIADTLDDFPLRTATLMYLGRAHTSLADFTRAIELLSKVVTSLSGDLSREHLGLPVLPAVFARSLLAVCLAETGRFAEAARVAEESIQLAEERKHPDTSFWAYRGAGVASLMRGDGPRASELFEQALAVCRAHDLPVYFSAVTSDLGHAYAVCDRTSEALPLLERAVEGASAGNQLYSLLMLQLGEGYLSAGRRREARECAESARTIAADRQERGREAHALRLLADVSRADGTPGMETAERLYGESAVLAERYGLRPLLAQCLLGLGLAHRQRGDREAAVERVTEAAHHFEQMNMVTWLKRAQEALVTLV